MSSFDIVVDNKKPVALIKGSDSGVSWKHIISEVGVDAKGEDIIMVDTKAGFLRSNESELPDLKKVYDWVPSTVSCRNLNSGESFRYNLVTQQKDLMTLTQVNGEPLQLNLLTTLKNVAVPAKVDAEGQDIIMVDTSAGFLRSNESELPDLKEVYDWVPTTVSCHNLNSGESFRYDLATQKKDLIIHEKKEKASSQLNLLTTLKNVAVPAKVDTEGEDIIMVDTSAGFLRSSFNELPTLKEKYDWIPSMVSCRNLNSGERFEYNIKTKEKGVVTPAKVEDVSKDMILVDSEAGFIRCFSSNLPDLKRNYVWVPEIVNCRNLTTSERFKYNTKTKKVVREEGATLPNSADVRVDDVSQGDIVMESEVQPLNGSAIESPEFLCLERRGDSIAYRTIQASKPEVRNSFKSIPQFMSFPLGLPLTQRLSVDEQSARFEETGNNREQLSIRSSIKKAELSLESHERDFDPIFTQPHLSDVHFAKHDSVDLTNMKGLEDLKNKKAVSYLLNYLKKDDQPVESLFPVPKYDKKDSPCFDTFVGMKS